MSTAPGSQEQRPGDAFPWGPYHRLKSGTQTDDVAELQRESGELWGKVARSGVLPQAKAFRGALGAHDHGVEFFSEEPPDLGRFGYLTWSPGRRGVWLDGEYAKIRIKVTKVIR
jgi:hypothetical protein